MFDWELEHDLETLCGDFAFLPEVLFKSIYDFIFLFVCFFKSRFLKVSHKCQIIVY